LVKRQEDEDMTKTLHLDTETINGLLTRSLEARRLRELENHVQSCLRCSLAVEAAATDPARWERRGLLGRLAPVSVVPGARMESVSRAA
jgi:hypothetical protein